MDRRCAELFPAEFQGHYREFQTKLVRAEFSAFARGCFLRRFPDGWPAPRSPADLAAPVAVARDRQRRAANPALDPAKALYFPRAIRNFSTRVCVRQFHLNSPSAAPGALPARRARDFSRFAPLARLPDESVERPLP